MAAVRIAAEETFGAGIPEIGLLFGGSPGAAAVFAHAGKSARWIERRFFLPVAGAHDELEFIRRIAHGNATFVQEDLAALGLRDVALKLPLQQAGAAEHELIARTEGIVAHGIAMRREQVAFLSFYFCFQYASDDDQRAGVLHGHLHGRP